MKGTEKKLSTSPLLNGGKHEKNVDRTIESWLHRKRREKGTHSGET